MPRKLSYASHLVVARAYDAEGRSASHSVTVWRVLDSVAGAASPLTEAAAREISPLRHASLCSRDLRLRLGAGILA